MKDAAGEAGFTLVEMLVALACSALIGVLMLQALRATGFVSANDRRASEQGEVQAVREHLRRTFAELAGRRLDGTRPPLLGRPDALDAVVAANRDLERGSSLRVRLALAPASDRPGLALVETRRLAAGFDGEDPPEILLEGIEDLRVRYFGAAKDSPQPRWLAGWTRRDRLPSLIEIAVAFPPNDRRQWRPLLIPVGGAP